MSTVSRVLVAFDFGVPAHSALSWAASLHRALPESALLAVHVVKPVVVSDAGAMPSLVEPDGIPAVEDLLRAAVTPFDADAWVRVVVGANVAQEILSLARSLRASLIVLGTHARPRTARFILGSVSDAVVHGAHCPVVVVHETDRGP
jgi:nucleotide-binding universal stress UspA family protein